MRIYFFSKHYHGYANMLRLILDIYTVKLSETRVYDLQNFEFKLNLMI